MLEHKIHLQKKVWTTQAFLDPKWAMGDYLHGLHDTTPKWNRMDAILVVVD
jgi:hypothetical protein